MKKVVVRHLPPDITENTFKDNISPIPPFDYFRFSNPDKLFGKNGTSFANIHFLDESSPLIFKEKLEKIKLKSADGTEYCPIVEYAILQSIPPKKDSITKDKRENTILGDKTFQEFVNFIENPPKNDICLATMLSQVMEREKAKNEEVKSTNLLNFLREKAVSRSNADLAKKSRKRKKKKSRRNYERE